jgi:hypothetical protein
MMKSYLGMTLKPFARRFIFMDVEVIQDNVQVTFGKCRHDIIHKPKEVGGGAPLLHVRQNLTAGDLQRCKKRLSAVPDVFIRPTARLLCSQRQKRLRPVQSLNAGFLIDTENQGIVGRVQVQTNYVQEFGFKVWIRAERKGSDSVRLQIRRDQYLMNRTRRQVQIFRQRSHRPSALRFGLLTHTMLYFLPDVRAMLGRSARTESIFKPVKPIRLESLSPLSDSDFGQSKRRSDLLVCLARCRTKDDANALGKALRRRRSSFQVLQCGFGHGVQGHNGSNSRHGPNISQLR